MNIRLPTWHCFLAVIWAFTTFAFAQTSSLPTSEHSIVAQSQLRAIDNSRAEEWKRCEVFESQHKRSPSETNSVGYIEVIAVPLLVLIVIVGVVGIKDF